MERRSAPLYRLFFAVKPDAVTARRTDWFAEQLAGDAPRILPAHQHMTIAITHDHDGYPYEAIKALIRAGTRVREGSFDLTLDHLSISNRSVALRPSRAVPGLARLAQALGQAMDRTGVARRPGWRFSPHQTLFYREGRPEHRAVEGFCWRVEEFVLICSHVGRTRHEVLARWPLEGTGQLSLF